MFCDEDEDEDEEGVLSSPSGFALGEEEEGTDELAGNLRPLFVKKIGHFKIFKAFYY